MTDTLKPEPALTPDDWIAVRGGRFVRSGVGSGTSSDRDHVHAVMVAAGGRMIFPEGIAGSVVHSPERLIALANAALPDTDPRKITRETVSALRIAAIALDMDAAAFDVDNNAHAQAVRALAAALASYLPPEG